MATIIGFGSVSVTKALKSGIQVDTYDNELHAVLCMIDHGSLGGGLAWGCKEHIRALQSIESKIADIRKANEAQEAGWT
jgi:hypothetical protein